MNPFVDVSNCCGPRKASIPRSPARIDDLGPLLRQDGESRKISGSLSFTRFQCGRCGQLWEFKLQCVGHQDWDETTYKIANEADQMNMAERQGVEFFPVRPDDKAGIALKTLSTPPLNALRHPSGQGTSGWYIWGGETLSSDPDFFEPVHHRHLTTYCPALLPYLGLPPGWRVLLAPGQEEVWFDASLLEV